MESTYILITAAYNEELYIERTIKSVVSQTILPGKWIIVSDGSTDSTDEIIRRYAEMFPFIQYVRIESKDNRNFQSKVYAIRAGYREIRAVESDFIGNLDADIVLVPGYYEALMGKFNLDPALGISSGTFFERKGKSIKKYVFPLHHTPGAIQLFRRLCFEQIGGYPLLNGGEDSAAEIKARMMGWKTESIPSLEVEHLKPMGSGNYSNILRVHFKLGEVDYNLGMHPLFAIVKFLRRILIRPFFFGGMALFMGFLYGSVRNRQRPVADNFVRFFRKEQMKRLFYFFNKGR